MADREDASEDSTEEDAAGDRPGHTEPEPRGREAAPGRGHTLVVGAGLAGLAAADRLAKGGERVTVIEGRDRTGGRIHSVRDREGTVLDTGASWMHGEESNPLSNLVRETGVRTSVFNRSTETAYDPKGRRLLFDRHRRNMEDVNLLQEHMYWTTVGAGRRESMAEGIDQALLDANLFRGRARDAKEIAQRIIESDHGAQPEEVTFSAMGAMSEFSGDDVVFPDGMDQLADHLARGLDVRLERAVTSVSHDGNGVRVRVQGPAGEETLTGDRVLLTLPLGVLKAGQVDFAPGLPWEKTGAIERLGNGRLEKLFLRFDQIFWGDAEVLVHLGTESGTWFRWYAAQRVLGAPVLICRNGGRAARALEGMEEGEAVEHAMASIRKMFRKAPDPVDHLITDWMADPFARGSFSYTAVGSSDADRRVLAEPIGERVFFAGEATEVEHFATVHGAMISGLREAAHMLA